MDRSDVDDTLSIVSTSDEASTCVEPNVDSTGNPQIEHTVQFYDTQDYLIGVIANFIAPLLKTKDAAVVVATKDKLDALEQRLRLRGVAIEAAKANGQFLLLDALEILAKTYNSDDDENSVNLLPIHEILQQLRDKYPKIYIYAELVNVLCDRGEHNVALHLEEIWQGILEEYDIMLLCGYDMNNFKESHHEEAFRNVCSVHCPVVPNKDQITLPTE
jgi:hypothetical protein